MTVDDNDRLQLQIEVWKKTVDVQQHFNDIELRVRGLALTVLTAVLGAAAVALRYGVMLHVRGCTVALASLLVALGLLVWLAFYFMDQVWYHRLLMGAVRHGEALEESLKDRVPGIELTRRISDESPYRFKLVGRQWKIHSRHKINIFYGFVIALLLVAVILLQLGNPSVSQSTSFETSGSPKISPSISKGTEEIAKQA